MIVMKDHQTIETALTKLERSKFRSSFHLRENDKAYIQKVGLSRVEEHAKVFIKERLGDAYPQNDGKQTPMKGHPVFIAQHACACCCRGCLEKWYHVPKGVPLTQIQQDKIVGLLMAWIKKELE